MAAGDYLTWAVQSQDAPAHVARILQTILLNEGVVDVVGGSFDVTEDTGANMNIQIGSGTLGDLAVVEGDDTAGQGVYVIEAQNATVTKTIAASDPSDDRIDLVVLQNYDDEADSSGNNDAEVEVIEGTPAGSPSAPSLPDSAIPLAEVLVGAGVTAITDANVTDLRAEVLLRTGLLAPPYSIRNRTPGGADFSVPNGTVTTIPTQNVESEDAQDAFTVTTNTVTIVRPGVYLLGGGIRWEANSTGDRRIFLRVNGSPVAEVDDNPISGFSHNQIISREVALVENDTFDVALFQNSGGSLLGRAARHTFRTIRFIRDLP